MFVSVDGEGKACADGLMDMVSISFGREDGTSKSLSVPDGERLTGQQVIGWLIDELSGHYTDPAGKEWRQSLVAFHFGWDTSVICKDFAGPGMLLVHKATGRKDEPLCNSNHLPGEEPCLRLHRDNPDHIQLIITEGGEGGIIALDTESEYAVTASPKRRFYAEHRPNGDMFEGNRRIDIHDTGTAFVGGLLRVLDVWQPELTAEQKAAIEWGKQARKDGFLGGTIAQIEEYSEAECVGHARACRLLIESVLAAGGIPVRPSELYGSGSVAGAAYKFHSVPKRDDTHVGDVTAAGVGVDDMARLTYFGGVIETPVLGRIAGTVDEVDLNSAYPAQAVRLPCMREGHGAWVRQRGSWRQTPPDGAVGHVLATWRVAGTSTGPFVVRTRDGRVKQPMTGYRVWVTLPEYVAAVERFGDKVMCHETVWWTQSCECVNPLVWIADLYAERQRIKAAMKDLPEGSPEWQALKCREEAIKLVINSCYGKLAQQRPTLGKYTNLHYASFITGGTRAEVRRETWRREAQGGTVVYMHTDSVLSVGGTPTDGGKALGAWGMEKQSHGLVIVQPGLAVSLDGGKSASRGCGISQFRKATEEWVTTTDLTKPPHTWDPMTIPRQMMISRRLAIARNKPELAGSFQDMPLSVSFNSTKRDMLRAIPMPGNPEAWIIPACEVVYGDEVATLDDLKDYQSRLNRMISAGAFDSD
jgi:hypothetical protein